jgi:hypothetical protein
MFCPAAMSKASAFTFSNVLSRNLLDPCQSLASPKSGSTHTARLLIARSGDLLGNGEMLVMRTIEDPANPIGKFVCSKHSIGLYNFSLAVHPLGLDGVQPRTPLRKKATDGPHTFTALLEAAVVFS